MMSITKQKLRWILFTVFLVEINILIAPVEGTVFKHARGMNFVSLIATPRLIHFVLGQCECSTCVTNCLGSLRCSPGEFLVGNTSSWACLACPIGHL